MHAALPTQFLPAERAEPDTLKRQAGLFTSDSLIHQVMEAAPEVFTVLNQERQIIYANRLMRELTGVEELKAVLGKRPGEALSCLHAGESAGGCGTTEFCRTCGAARAILTSQRGQADAKECRILRENGDALDLRVYATPVSIEGQNFTVFSAQDISGEKRRRVLERTFFHDVLNTAGGVMGLASLVKEGSHEEKSEYAGMLEEVASALVDEIQAHRALVAAEANELALNIEAVRPGQVLNQVLRQYQNHEIARGKTLALVPDLNSPVIATDPTLLRRVIGNMVKNALEASKPGESVRMGWRVSGSVVIFWVNNPAVMPRDIQLQIFQRSFSTKGSGRGIGTYSIKLLGERYLKGQVGFTSSAEKGTTFFLQIPIQHPDQAEPPG